MNNKYDASYHGSSAQAVPNRDMKFKQVKWMDSTAVGILNSGVDLKFFAALQEYVTAKRYWRSFKG